MDNMTDKQLMPYCWFGDSTKPKLFWKCFKVKRYCPDYEIIEWDENHFIHD